jgi:hypothetical protein
LGKNPRPYLKNKLKQSKKGWGHDSSDRAQGGALSSNPNMAKNKTKQKTSPTISAETIRCFVCVYTSWYLRENKIIFKFKNILWVRPLIRSLVQKKYYSCVTKSKPWKKKIKGREQSGKMSGFQNAVGDRIKSMVIFKLVLNILFSSATFH